MSEKTLRGTYGHHHPDYLRSAATAFSNKLQSLVISLGKSGSGVRCGYNPLRTLVADAVVVEPVSTPQFPANREKEQGIFQFRRSFARQTARKPNDSVAFELNSLLNGTGNFWSKNREI